MNEFVFGLIVGLIVEVLDVVELVGAGFLPSGDPIEALYEEGLFFGNFHRFFLCPRNVSIVHFRVGSGHPFSF